ncbi:MULTISPECIES: cyclase family protein [unclassified Wenzhouxiangella]|uniref:cyclase family protein n=1 Tax=unclassified Wenzhouxiangella TaxID=2613841 RepID=UPI000E3297F7|nr:MULTISPECIES: cyclase family protein [unclassified Wenzhouxiangella]RFF27493.1 cyclase family protein [Wenzhouxiangella sp. 15181]RFP69645.1 cyclase family protein [Wenzhouxiangella sp. 15190]
MRRLIDLSHTVEDGLVTYRGLPAPIMCDFLSREDSKEHYEDGTSFHIGRIDMVANTGTYVDSPFHRFADGKDLSELELESLAELPGLCVHLEADLSSRTPIRHHRKEQQSVSSRTPIRDLPEDGTELQEVTRAIGPEAFEGLDVTGKAVLVHTGWANHWNTDAYFEGHPFLTREAAEWLRDHGAALVGIDSLNIDDIEDGERPVHTTLLGADIPIAEHLRGLEQLPESGFTFHAAPVKVRGMGTFPVRAYAVLGGMGPPAG